MSGHVEYGADGLTYCGQCIFYGLNRPCWKCRMYLPSAEMQMYKGQLACPYCIMDMRDEDRRIEEYGRPKPERERYASERQEERCERCGRTLSTVYYFGGKRLCSTCAEEEKKAWQDKGGEKPPMMLFRVKQEKGLVSSIVQAVENRIGEAIRGKKPPEKAEKGKETGKEKKPPEPAHKEDKKKGPLSEGLQKTSGLKYIVSDYKDMPIDDKAREKKPQENKKSKKAKKQGRKKKL